VSPQELEEFAKDVALAIRGGEAIPEGCWDGESFEDHELTSECRRVAATLAVMGYSKQRPIGENNGNA
jgi:hypothetical protein